MLLLDLKPNVYKCCCQYKVVGTLSCVCLSCKDIIYFSFSVGVYKNGHVEIIANDQGNRITPSYVAFTGEGERLIGDAAKNQLTTNPENTVFDAKRLIGRTWKDPTVQKDIKYWPFMTRNRNEKPHVEIDIKGEKKLFAAEEISAMVLVKMKVRDRISIIRINLKYDIHTSSCIIYMAPLM